jgi:ketosteroid isomerase-like protein
MDEIDWEERLRDGLAAYNRGDYEQVLAYASDDVELKRTDDSPDSMEILHGRAAVLGWFQPDAFTDQHLELLKLDTGVDSVVGHLRFTARGAGSGMPVEIESFVVYRLDGGLVRRLEVYNEEPAARAAAGLRT